MTIAEAASILKGDPPSERSTLIRRVGEEPAGPRSALMERTLASNLGAAPQDVRVVWANSEGAGGDMSSPLTLFLQRGPIEDQLADTSFTGIITSAPRPVPQPDVQALFLQMPQPSFIAGLRRSDGRWWVAQTAEPFWSGWRLRLLMACGICLLLVTPLTWLFARRITRPLRELADRAAASQPLAGAPRGPTEVQTAAEAIDRMRHRLAEEAAERVRMVAAVAHDLRTPLTSIRLRVERAPPQVRARVADDIARMETMIVDVLNFARAETLVKVPLDLRNLAGERIEQADGGSGRLRLVEGPPVLVDGDQIQLGRVLDNLLQNAVLYAGSAEVDVIETGEYVVLTVSDHGPGVAATDRERLLAPFVRGEASRNRDTGGAGLGLSIVRDIVERHGGRFQLHANHGGGTVAECRLPLRFGGDMSSS